MTPRPDRLANYAWHPRSATTSDPFMLRLYVTLAGKALPQLKSCERAAHAVNVSNICFWPNRARILAAAQTDLGPERLGFGPYRPSQPVRSLRVNMRMRLRTGREPLDGDGRRRQSLVVAAIAGLSLPRTTAWVLIRRLNSSCSRSIAFVVLALRP